MTVDDTHAEQLVSKAPAAAHLTSSTSTSIQSLYEQAVAQRSLHEQQQDERYVSLAPTFLSLHQQAVSSKQLLSSLESFLSTFQSDLSTLSTHISALQSTSHQIDSRLDATRDVEIQLAGFLSDIALSPRIVDLFFETEPESRPEMWLKAVRQLERVLEATSPSATLRIPGEASSTSMAEVGDVQAVKEVRGVAEACRNVVAAKLRTYLTAPHASIKASVTTNLQVLQTSVLLRHHRPLYAFLARQMPRVAIDVQRSYVGAARLYFETAFRRYARSLGVVRKRWTEPASPSLITDPPPSSTYAATAITSLQSSMAALSKTMATSSSSAGGQTLYGASRPGGSSTPSRAEHGDADAMAASDAWLFPAPRLQYAKLDSPAATVLGYLADEPAFKACPESLFRSLSLVLIDNACSEYCFLVRFFEGVGSDEDDELTAKAQSKLVSAAVGPDESASAVGDETVADGPEASVVQLSLAEQNKLQGRGASEEIFKQIMEPALSTWTTFTKSLLSPSASLAASATSVALAGATGLSAGSVSGPAGYFSLLAMVQLNDALLQLVSERIGGNSGVESALMGFKIAAYPLLKRFLDDQITALAHLANPASSAGGGGMWGVFGAITSTASSSLTSALAQAIAVRYASLFTKTLYILATDPNSNGNAGGIPDPGLIAALTRLRSQLASLLTASKPTATWTNDDKRAAIQSLIKAIEASTTTAASSLTSHPNVQNEFSFWSEQLKLV